MNILITGTAGFIGFHLVQRLLSGGHTVYGMDNLNDYYDITLKEERLACCGISTPVHHREERVSTLSPHYTFCRMDLNDTEALEELFATHPFDCVVNLAAQAGVRYSLTHPRAYVTSNISGFLNVLEACRKFNIPRLIYASSSSVYGNNTAVPFKEESRVDHPVSLYAASKRSNELMAFTYAQLYRMTTIGLRFFTVYGPYGRPDMAPMLFAKAIQNEEEIRVFNRGELSRDFTYIDDIITGIEKIILTPGIKREEVPGIPAILYNIGRGEPVQLMDFIRLLEEKLGKTARKRLVEMQPGDVYQTWADTSHLQEDYGYSPHVSLNEGITKLVEWLTAHDK